MLKEFVFLGRGGQGLYTATELLSRAIFIDGYYVQSVPFFGAERRGAVTFSYLRISNEKIMRHDRVRIADGLIIGDGSQEVMEFLNRYVLKSDGKIIINLDRVNLSRLTRMYEANEIFVINADNITKSEGLNISGWPIIGSVMAGAFSKVFGVPRINSLLEVITSLFSNENSLQEINKKLVVRGYSEVRLLKHELQKL